VPDYIIEQKIDARLKLLRIGNQTIKEEFPKTINQKQPDSDYDDRYSRRFASLAVVGFIMANVNRLMFFPSELYQNDLFNVSVEKRQPLLINLLTCFINVAVNYCAYKYVNNNLSVTSIVSDLKDLPMVADRKATSAAEWIRDNTNMFGEKTVAAAKWTWKNKNLAWEKPAAAAKWTWTGAIDGVKFCWTKIRNKYRQLKEEIFAV
jgi:hypothetical protein